MKWLTRSSFNWKYYTKSPTKLAKIVKSNKWIIIDIRAKGDFVESHVINSVNLPHNTFKLTYSKYVSSNKKILFISTAGHSHLDLYWLLKKHNLKVYILQGGWKAIHNKEEYDPLITFSISL